MNEDYKKAIDQHPEIKHYTESIPRQLGQLLLPSDIAAFPEFSKAIKALRIKEKERDYIIELRKKYGLPFQPNASIEETIKRVRLIRWQRKKKAESEWTEHPDESSSADRIDPDEELI